RRGGNGTLMWALDELDRFLLGTSAGTVIADRPGAPSIGGTDEPGERQEEVDLKVEDLGGSDRFPGIWKRKEGGFVVRARTLDPATGGAREIRKVLPEADELTAVRWQQVEVARTKAGVVEVASSKTRFAEFAPSLFERKSGRGRSAALEVVR